jgi:endonuclease YncB( thermonuclease family)
MFCLPHSIGCSRTMRWTIPIVAFLIAWPVTAAPISSSEIRVTDGDTIRVAGESVRLVGFNAP